MFLDHVYRRIERWIDGDAVKRRALRNAPLSAGKVDAPGGEAYAVSPRIRSHHTPVPGVLRLDSRSLGDDACGPRRALGSVRFHRVATGILYFNFAWFREQLCIVICPYGRLQSALIDDHSLVIGYDAARGEPRGRRTAVVE